MAGRVWVWAWVAAVVVMVAGAAWVAAPPQGSEDSDTSAVVGGEDGGPLRRLLWWWGGNEEEEEEEVPEDNSISFNNSLSPQYSHSTTAHPHYTINTTEKPSRWRSWLGKITGMAKKIKTGIKKGYNATKQHIKTAGRAIGRGAVSVGSAIKSGYRKVKLKFFGSEEKFRIVTNRLKNKLEAGDEKAVELMKKLGIQISYIGSNITGSKVQKGAKPVTDVLEEEGMLRNRTSMEQSRVEDWDDDNATAVTSTARYPSFLFTSSSSFPYVTIMRLVRDDDDDDDDDYDDDDDDEEEEEEEERMSSSPSTTTTTTTTIPTTTTTTTTTTPPTTTTTTTTTPTTTTTTTTTTSSTTPTITNTPTTTTAEPSTTTTLPSPAIKPPEPDRTIEEPYEPPPFPDVFSDDAVKDRLKDFYDNGDFSHSELSEIFNFDPDNYEYAYGYEYEY